MGGLRQTRTGSVPPAAFQPVGHRHDCALEADPTARLVALCREVGADTYLAGRDSTAYVDLAQFKAAGIAVEAQRYEHPVYAQLHGEFAPLLSALDLLLMHGDEALAILRRGNTWQRLSP